MCVEEGLAKVERILISISRRLRLALLAGALILLIKSFASVWATGDSTPVTGHSIEIPARPDEMTARSGQILFYFGSYPYGYA